MSEKHPPWLKSKKLKNPPLSTDNHALERFFLGYSMLNPSNVKRIVSDNLSKEERKVISEIRTWDNRLVRLQDKGARFVVINRDEYCDKIVDNVKSGGHQKITLNDPTQKNLRWVFYWAKNGKS